MYEEDWRGWDDFLGVTLPFEDARAVVRSVCPELGVKSQEDWWKLVEQRASLLAELRVPVQPHIYYRATWQGYDDWLGAENQTLYIPKEWGQQP